ncbi:MAG: C40 family peptidase [Treponema sp.]|uniref:C40 family peptidase n=1 Tax=Treponema sp. TaxID=166 RepID=UPI001B4C9364|nr:C40 family peptidase [Treponema sp.]MBP5403270.1 C40 family peptidase [Treponema sp.]MBR5932685.1 C40 family peptidase [Treponema sp.]
MKVKKFFCFVLFFFTLSFSFAREYSKAEAARLREAVCAKVKTYIGCPYRTGGIGPDSFDCSGLIFTVFREAASIQLPRSAKAIYSTVTIVSTDKMEEGDLVFFKTTGDGSISHVGIYIGRNQFVHAASDGANTGVIASSLTEKYYKNCFAGVGKVITTAKSDKKNPKNDDSDEIIEEEIINEDSTVSSSEKKSFFDSLVFDTTTSCDWSLWLPNKFMINFRGIAVTTVARYTGWKVQPGLGTTLRWNSGTETFQIPITFSLTFNDYVNIYAGPVITFGNPSTPDYHERIKSSFFPGIIGVSFNTPSFDAGKVKISIAQDLSYTVFNDTDGGALSFGDSLCTGFVFSTGIRVTLPLKNVLK